MAGPDAECLRGLGGGGRTKAGVPAVWHLRVVTDRSGEVVGVGWVLPSRDSGYVMSLAVRKDQRGRGLARALLVDCFEVSRGAGMARAELSTDSRTGALGLYERVGMEITQTWLHRDIAV